MLRQSLLRLAASLAVSALALVGLAAPASAHNALRTTDPADGSTVATVPEAVTLTFDGEVVALGSVVEVVNPAGDVVSDGEPDVSGAEVTQALAGYLLPGDYIVTWRVTSGDGHPIAGSFTFTAESGRDETTETTEPSQPAEPTETATAAPTESAPAETTTPPVETPSPTQDTPTATPSPTQDQTAVPAGPLEPDEPRSPQAILATLGILVALGALLVMMIGKQRRFAERTAATRDAGDAGDDSAAPHTDEGPRA